MNHLFALEKYGKFSLFFSITELKKTATKKAFFGHRD